MSKPQQSNQSKQSKQQPKKARKTAIVPTREQDYPEWYQQVVRAAELAETSDVRGCMVIKPWGMSLWENMHAVLDRRFKETGHENAYFPLFIPMSYLEKEAEHVEGFAKECAVVTHHRLEPSPDGGLQPAGELEEPLIVRPTSETIIGATYARWVQSYRDLPILINQWANVVRWELRTRLFLRTAEFLWQEGHTVHATSEEAVEETERMIEVYREFAEDYMAMPCLVGRKTPEERFPGAVETYTIEAMMQDRKALQAGTSHFLGQNFSKAQDITFASADETIEHAWTTSWGVSTRLVGGLVMTHADDDGLKLPPRLAPSHVVILPIYRGDGRDAVLESARQLKAKLEAQTYDGAPVRVRIDDRDLRGGEKSWGWVKKGVPLRVELGQRDIDGGTVFVARRDVDGKGQPHERAEFVGSVASILAEMQTNLFETAKRFRDEHTQTITDAEAFRAYFAGDDAPGYAIAPWRECETLNAEIAKLKVTARCIPLEQPEAAPPGCLFTGEPTEHWAVFAKAY